MPTASSYDGALLRVAHQRVADLRDQLRKLSAAYASCVPGRDDKQMEELEKAMTPIVCRLQQELALQHELEEAEEKNWLQITLSEVPEPLRSKRAMSLWHRLWKARLVDSCLKPMVSRRQAALIADELAKCLSLSQRWVHFERLWNVHNLRGDCNKAYGSPSCNGNLKPIIEALYGKERE